MANKIGCFKSVIEFLVAGKYKPSEIYKRMYDVYGEACFSKKKISVLKWAKHGFTNTSLSRKDSP